MSKQRRLEGIAYLVDPHGMQKMLRGNFMVNIDGDELSIAGLLTVDSTPGLRLMDVHPADVIVYLAAPRRDWRP
jgi:hypothetical protein